MLEPCRLLVTHYAHNTKEIIMRAALHSHHHAIHLPTPHVSKKTQLWLNALLSATIPYLLAALFLFAYHEQWFQ